MFFSFCSNQLFSVAIRLFSRRSAASEQHKTTGPSLRIIIIIIKLTHYIKEILYLEQADKLPVTKAIFRNPLLPEQYKDDALTCTG